MNANIITPKLSFYHPNCKGTGSAIAFELAPAHGNKDGAIFARIANQKDSLHFDWENGITVRLGFLDVCKILQVLRGETESIDDCKGLYMRSVRNATIVRLEHVIEPSFGYRMNFSRTEVDDTGRLSDNETKSSIVFTPAEALGISIAFEGALKDIAFGTGFEATSISIARDEENGTAEKAGDAVERDASVVEEIMKAIPVEEREHVYKAIAKVNAVATLCLAYGKEYNDRISKAVDIACGDAEGACVLTDEEIKLGKDVLKDDHPIWNYVVIEHSHIK